MNLTNIVAIGFIVLMTGLAIGFLLAARRLLVTTFNREHDAQIRHENAASVYIIRGYAKRDAGDLEGAISDFQKALQLQPDHQEAAAIRETVSQLQKLLT